MTPVRLGLVGLGGISQSVHLPLIQRNRSDIDLVAVAELSPSSLSILGRRYGVPDEGQFASGQELAAAISDGRIEVDAAIVATTGSHINDALSLIRAGVKVLVEKPLAYSFSEIDTLLAGLKELDRDADSWLRIGYMKEYDPAVAAARQLLTEVTPREVVVEVLHPDDAHQMTFARLGPRATDVNPQDLRAIDAAFEQSITGAIGTDDAVMRKLYTNVVLGSIIHDIALTRHLGLGLSDMIHAKRWGAEFPGSVIGSGATTDGVPWSIRWHFIKDFPVYRETVTIHHERGSIELEFATPYILNAPTKLRVHTGDEEFRSTQTEQTWPQEEAFERELSTLVAMARGQRPNGSSIEAARRDLTSAQTLWRACAATAGITIDPTCEAAPRSTGGSAGDRDHTYL